MSWPSLTLVMLFLFMPMMLWAQGKEERRAQVTFKTNLGTIVVELYNETPLHRDNLIRMVDAGVYKGVLFHRVIKDFMIQAGDPNSRHARPGQHLGDGDASEPIPAEFRYPQLFHKRGALAAAREGDEVNPSKQSSSSQFYIVWGKTFSDAELDRMQLRMDTMTGGTARMTESVRQTYQKWGGTPHLDGSYTVFGEVVRGLEIVDLIELQPTDKNNRPIEDIRIKKAKVTRRLKK